MSTVPIPISGPPARVIFPRQELKRRSNRQSKEPLIKARNYTTSANGVISGTTEIQGVEVGFRGKIVGDEVRVSTVFTKR
jgi:hypothetical protein